MGSPIAYSSELAYFRSRTRAIIAQNTFGLSADLDPILALAKDKGIEVIDDCTHGLGGTHKGKPNDGSVTRVSFFSTQWNKPFSTGIGGVAVSKDAALAAKLQQFEEALIITPATLGATTKSHV